MKEMMNETMELTMDELEQVNGGSQGVTLTELWRKLENTIWEPDPFLPPFDPEPFGPIVDPNFRPLVPPYINKLYTL